jgi:membrane protein YqaA with SNARE-associated domain
MSWFGLFIYSALAATLLPGGSEVLFAGLLATQPENGLWLWLIATIGNTLGAVITFAMGGLLAYWQARPAPSSNFKLRLQKTFTLSSLRVQQLKRYGPWLLLLSWLPLVGDGFCLAAGYLGWPKWRSLCLIAFGKAVRYGGLWYLLLQV